MLIINKGHINTSLIATLSESNPVTTGSTLLLEDQFTNVSTTFALPIDSSPYPSRYNQFDFVTTFFSGLSESTYTYTVKDANGNVTETGLLKVVADVLDQDLSDEYVFISPTSPDDDFIVYNK